MIKAILLFFAVSYLFTVAIGLFIHNKECKNAAELLRKAITKLGYAQWTCTNCGTRLNEKSLFWYDDKPMCRPCQYEELNKPQPSYRMAEIITGLNKASETKKVEEVYWFIKEHADEVKDLAASNPADAQLWKVAMASATTNLFMKGD